jgi:hypothetical protein
MGFRWWMVGLALVAACGRPPEPRVDAGGSSPAGMEPDTAAQDAAESPLKKQMLKAADEKKKRDAQVGGCRESCEDPKNAFRNFVRALWETGGEELPGVKKFIDTTMLKDNGKELGSQWADMWLDGRLEERMASIEAWLSAYRGRVGRPLSASAVEGALAHMEFRRLSSSVVEVTFVTPELTAATVSDRWVVTLGMRGLEWQVQAIEDGR